MSNIAYDKSFKFSLKVIDTYKYLCEHKKEYIISKQLLRSGTSIGANLKEGLYGQSKRDFLAKVNIALKESAETEYWLEFLIKSKYFDEDVGNTLLAECREITKILYVTVRTTKEKLKVEDKDI